MRSVDFTWKASLPVWAPRRDLIEVNIWITEKVLGITCWPIFVTSFPLLKPIPFSKSAHFTLHLQLILDLIWWRTLFFFPSMKLALYFSADLRDVKEWETEKVQEIKKKKVLLKLITQEGCQRCVAARPRATPETSFNLHWGHVNSH